MRHITIFVLLNLVVPAAIAQTQPNKVTRSEDAEKSSRSYPQQVYPYPQSGVRIGQGWDSFNEQGTSAACVNVAETRLERASYETQVQQVQGSYSLATQATTSISASYRGMGASASGSLATSSSLTVSADDQNFLFTFSSSAGSTFAVPPQDSEGDPKPLSEEISKGLAALKSDAAQQLYLNQILQKPQTYRTGNIELTGDAENLFKTNKKRFRRECGDGYVSAIHRGSRINVLLTQRLASHSQASSLSASLSASGYGGSINGSYSTSKTEAVASAALSYRWFQEGGVPLRPKAMAGKTDDLKLFDVNTILPSPDDLVANPTAFQVTVTPYENLIKDNDIEELPSPTKLLTLADYYLALRDHYRLLGGILDHVRLLHPENVSVTPPGYQFNPKIIEVFGGVAGLENLYDTIRLDLVLLEGAIADCYKNASDCTLSNTIRKSTLKQGEILKEYLATPRAQATETSRKRQLQNLRPQSGAADKAQVERLSRPLIEFSAAAPSPISKDDLLVALSDAQMIEIEKIQKEGRLTASFLARFYLYLMLTPLPTSAYADYPFETLKDLKYTGDAASLEVAVEKANAQLQKAMLRHRVMPWKNFFCQTLQSEPMCVSEHFLKQIATLAAARVRVAGEQFKFVAVDPVAQVIEDVPYIDYDHCLGGKAC